MNLFEARDILEIDEASSPEEIKEQFRWLVKFYHPDNIKTGDIIEFRKIILAYNVIVKEKEK